MDGEDLDLNKLTSNILYKQWDEGDQLNPSRAYCSYVTTDPMTYIKVEKLCRRLIRNLDDMLYESVTKHYSVGRCKLFNYWLYNKVNEALGSEYAVHFKRTMHELHTSWNNYKNNERSMLHAPAENKCEPDTTIISLSNIEDKKRIHEHCLNYHEFIKNSNNYREDCEKYEEYIKGKSSEYHKFESLLTEEKNTYENYYNICNRYNPINILPPSKCGSIVFSAETPDETPEEKNIPLGVEVGEGVRGDGLGAVVAEGLGGEARIKKKEELEEEIERIDEEEDDYKEREGEDDRTPPLNSQLLKPSSAKDLSMRIPEGGTLVDNLPSISNSTDNPRSNGTIISASCVGLTGFLFLLYKFTHLRTVLDPRIRKTKNMLKDGVQGSNELLLQDYNLFPPDVDTNKYNIAYQSR
ncbi:PIR protein [Plasmodium vivax]|nr:PIR protein [Plasmodium vivax]